MKILFAILTTAAALLLTGCQTNFGPQPLLRKVLVFSYADFGPESTATAWLGPRASVTQVVVHYSQSESALQRQYPDPGYRFVSVRSAIYHVGRTLRELPAGAPERTRVRATFAILREFEQDRRTALNASPPFAGRGALRRMAITY